MVKDKKEKIHDGFTKLEIDYGIRILETKEEMDYKAKTDEHGNIINPLPEKNRTDR